MELHQLRCFVAAAEQLHFGRAAQQLQMLPSALGRQIRLLEEDLGTRLFARTTRAVSLTDDGTTLLRDARAILARVEAVESNLRNRPRAGAARRLRVGAIDSAAAGLLPPLLRDFRARHPEIAVQLLEDKTVRLLPKILTGALDLAFVRPPDRADKRLEFRDLLQETAIVAFPQRHGVDRAAAAFRDLLAPQAERNGQIVLVPEFDPEQFPGIPAYNFGGVRLPPPDNTVQPRDHWNFGVIDRLFHYVRDAIGSSRETFGLFGNSAGAQFVLRYLALNEAASVDLAVAANCGCYMTAGDLKTAQILFRAIHASWIRETVQRDHPTLAS